MHLHNQTWQVASGKRPLRKMFGVCPSDHPFRDDFGRGAAVNQSTVLDAGRTLFVAPGTSPSTYSPELLT